MRKISLGRVLAIVALTLLVAGPAFAQETQQVVAGGWAPTVQFGNGSSSTYGKVFFGNLGIPVASKFQIVVDLTYLHLSGQPAFDGGFGMLGLRFPLPSGSKSIYPFVEGLGGVGYVSLGDNTLYCSASAPAPISRRRLPWRSGSRSTTSGPRRPTAAAAATRSGSASASRTRSSGRRTPAPGFWPVRAGDVEYRGQTSSGPLAAGVLEMAESA